MKYMLLLRQPHVWQAALRSAASKIAAAVCLLLLWDHFLNQRSAHPHGMVETGFFFLFLCFGIHAWIRYLALDGVRPFTMLSRKKEGNMSIEQISFRFSALLGFERNQVEAVDDRNLADDEVAVAKLSSSVLAACFFLIPSVIANVR
ncbi:MAG: hypothetical protein UEP78_08410 [Negativibacillus sp.]|nr:hypothetical protein [Negativibacillus sp.]